MDIYKQKSGWKRSLIIGGLIIMVAVVIYTNYLTKELAEGEETYAELILSAYEKLLDPNVDLNQDIGFEDVVLNKNRNIPIILVNEQYQYIASRNFPEDKSLDTVYMDREIERILKKGEKQLRSELTGNYILYKNSRSYVLLTYLPLVMVVLLGLYVLLGYISFSASRREEQNLVWVGMAKETAHQLGTPISAIIAWIEHLKLFSQNNNEQEEIITELEKDVHRLELIADRFSKIGSSPKLEKKNIFVELERMHQYMRKRSPQKVQFDFPGTDQDPAYVMMNAHLLNWVIENLLRNALDAMQGSGLLKAEVEIEDTTVTIDISDTGKGIEAKKLKTVFRPGYTTKKRGWGLGLSLAKRIIENYHNGKIFVKSSTENVGTTFSIKLPKVS